MASTFWLPTCYNKFDHLTTTTSHPWSSARVCPRSDPFSTVCRRSPPTDTRRPASAGRKARRQFQATGQPVSRTQASDAMASRLPRYEAKCVKRRCLQCGSVPLRSDIKGIINGATPSQYIDTTRKAIDCATTLPLRVFI